MKVLIQNSSKNLRIRKRQRKWNSKSKVKRKRSWRKRKLKNKYKNRNNKMKKGAVIIKIKHTSFVKLENQRDLNHGIDHHIMKGGDKTIIEQYLIGIENQDLGPNHLEKVIEILVG